MNHTPTHDRILSALGDCLPHDAYQLARELDMSLHTLRVHISNMRRSLRPLGCDVICSIGCFTLTRLMASPYSGYN